MFDFQTTAFLLDAAAQVADAEAKGPGTAIIPVAAGFLVAVGICGFFMRFDVAREQGSYSRRNWPYADPKTVL